MSWASDRGIRFFVSAVAACGIGVAGGPAAAQEPPEFDVVFISTFPHFYPSDLNNRGEVVGVHYSLEPGDPWSRAARWFDGELTPLEIDPPRTSTSTAINDNDQILGWVPASEEEPDQIFLFNAVDDIEYPLLGDLFDGSLYTGVLNNLGQFTGGYTEVVGLPPEPFFFDGETVHQLIPEAAVRGQATGLNDLGHVVGFYEVPTGVYTYTDKYAFFWSEGSRVQIGTVEERVTPMDINESSQVVGRATLFNENLSRAFLYQGGELHNLGTLGGLFSIALSINNNGWIVGESNTPPPSSGHAFLVVGGTMRDLNELVPTDLEWELTSGLKVNDRGQILVSAKPKDGPQSAVYLLLVPSAIDTVEELIELIEGFGLPHGIENSFLVKLEHALEAIEAGDFEGACSHLNAFANHIAAQAGKKLTEEQAEEVLEAVDTSRTEIGCSSS